MTRTTKNIYICSSDDNKNLDLELIFSRLKVEKFSIWSEKNFRNSHIRFLQNSSCSPTIQLWNFGRIYRICHGTLIPMNFLVLRVQKCTFSKNIRKIIIFLQICKFLLSILLFSIARNIFRLLRNYELTIKYKFSLKKCDFHCFFLFFSCFSSTKIFEGMKKI